MSDLICFHCTDIKFIAVDDGMCLEGEIRLVGGSRSGEGRVQMCFNGVWGSVCSLGFDEPEAQVTCRNLGFNIETTSECSYFPISSSCSNCFTC